MTKTSSSFILITPAHKSVGDDWGSQEMAESFRNFPEAYSELFCLYILSDLGCSTIEVSKCLEGGIEGRGACLINLAKTSCMKCLGSLVEYKYLRRIFACLPYKTQLSYRKITSPGDSIKELKTFLVWMQIYPLS